VFRRSAKGQVAIHDHRHLAHYATACLQQQRALNARERGIKRRHLQLQRPDAFVATYSSAIR
jgi:hypothetical protein